MLIPYLQFSVAHQIISEAPNAEETSVNLINKVEQH